MKKPGKKLGRNEPCHCGSGRKYKNCHYDKDRKEAIVGSHSARDPISPTHKALLGLK